MRLFGEPEASLRLPLPSPADLLVEKLAWFDSGGRASERPWQDVVGVLRVAAQSIDSTLLRELAAERGLLDLRAAAQKEAPRQVDATPSTRCTVNTLPTPRRASSTHR